MLWNECVCSCSFARNVGLLLACLVHYFDCFRCSDPGMAPDGEGLPRLERGWVGVRLRLVAPRPDDRAVDCRMWAGAVGSYVQRLMLKFLQTLCDMAAQMWPARAGGVEFHGTTQRRVGWSCEDSLPTCGPLRGNGGTAGASRLGLTAEPLVGNRPVEVLRPPPRKCGLRG